MSVWTHLLAQVLVQHDPKMAHELVLVAGLKHHGNTRDQVGSLHAHFGALVVQTPLYGAADLRKVWLHALS